MKRSLGRAAVASLLISAVAMPASAGELIKVAGIPFDFILFAMILVGVTLFHRHTFLIGLSGVVTITLFRLLTGGFREGEGVHGLLAHLHNEWVSLVNLLCLLMGFAFLSRHFEKSQVPLVLPKYLPENWKGNFILLIMIFVLSILLDNIAAALIGGAMAHLLFRGRVHIGFLAAIVAAANAGGSGSVVGGTTTTMMWIDGISPLKVIDAYVGAVVALCITAFFGARQQHAHSPIIKCEPEKIVVDKARVGIVIMILLAAIFTNMVVTIRFNQYAHSFPFIGVAVWLAILISVPIRRPDWEIMPQTFKGAVFLLSLITCASMMPVEQLPPPSAITALCLGGSSAIFDNIPLTALALRQGGHDWGVLAYAVGFGGSMLWFGSSAGVALSSMYPEAKSVSRWVRHGWHVAVAYLAGFAVLFLANGWHPDPTHKNLPKKVENQSAQSSYADYGAKATTPAVAK